MESVYHLIDDLSTVLDDGRQLRHEVMAETEGVIRALRESPVSTYLQSHGGFTNRCILSVHSGSKAVPVLWLLAKDMPSSALAFRTSW